MSHRITDSCAESRADKALFTQTPSTVVFRVCTGSFFHGDILTGGSDKLQPYQWVEALW
ncbi:MAG: hypothetical protein ACI9KE_003904 [Polyangiales bacterium]|jgi:hypothetical protein